MTVPIYSLSAMIVAVHCFKCRNLTSLSAGLLYAWYCLAVLALAHCLVCSHVWVGDGLNIGSPFYAGSFTQSLCCHKTHFVDESAEEIYRVSTLPIARFLLLLKYTKYIYPAKNVGW